MKILKNILLFTLLTSFMLVSCNQNDFNAPEFSEPKYTGKPANTTIKALKETYKEAITGVPVLIPEDANVIIKAVVTANDKSGNLFKKMTIQDETGAIDLPVNQYNLSNIYPVGQIVYLNCAGLYIGGYGGQAQLGALYNGKTGQLAPYQLDARMSKEGFFDLANLPKIPVIKYSNLTETNANDLIGTLVRLDAVSFEKGGKDVFAPAGSKSWNVNVKFSTGETIIMRTSEYASFAKNTVPTGTGSMIVILGNYNGTWQLTLRSTADLINFK